MDAPCSPNAIGCSCPLTPFPLCFPPLGGPWTPLGGHPTGEDARWGGAVALRTVPTACSSATGFAKDDLRSVTACCSQRNQRQNTAEAAGSGWENFGNKAKKLLEKAPVPYLIVDEGGGVVQLHGLPGHGRVLGGQGQAAQCVDAHAPVPDPAQDLLPHRGRQRDPGSAHADVGAALDHAFRGALGRSGGGLGAGTNLEDEHLLPALKQVLEGGKAQSLDKGEGNLPKTQARTSWHGGSAR